MFTAVSYIALISQLDVAISFPSLEPGSLFCIGHPSFGGERRKYTRVVRLATVGNRFDA
jgi:hypothetical protein